VLGSFLPITYGSCQKLPVDFYLNLNGVRAGTPVNDDLINDMIIPDLYLIVLIKGNALKDLSDSLGFISDIDFQAHPEVKTRIALGLSHIVREQNVLQHQDVIGNFKVAQETKRALNS
jgi:hypothetical protein